MHRPRDRFLLLATAFLVGVTVLVLAESPSWLGKPFPGFLLLANHVVPSAGLTRWPATAGGTIYQHEIVGFDEYPLSDSKDLHAYVAHHPSGTPISYRFRRDNKSFTRTIETRTFDHIDFTLLFGSLLFNGLAFGVTGLLIRYLRGRDPVANASFAMLFTIGIFSITAVDLYGPYRLFRVHALCESLVFASVLHMALVFPQPCLLVRKHRSIVPGLYSLAVLLALANQYGLYDPGLYRQTHQLATSALGAALLILIATQLHWYLRPPSFKARQRVKVVAFGAFASLSAPVVLALGSAFTGGEMPQNAMTFTAFFYPISIGYAVLRHNLLEVDVFVRRALNYAILTVIATLVYAGAVRSFNSVFHGSPSPADDSVGFIVTVLLVILLLPLRDRVQSGINRLFFRISYDYRQLVETTSERLASVADLEVIARELSHAIEEALHPTDCALYLRQHGRAVFSPFPESPDLPDLSEGQVEHLRNQVMPLDQPDGGLVVSFRADGELVAVLVLGRPRSGRIYGADERRLLQTFANQGAVAIENALALERLQQLNRDLEATVEERTRDLRQAHMQLVHREKMASLGQFVAGIAHEINNPLNFIQGNLFCLREYYEALQRALSSYEEALSSGDSRSVERVREIREQNEIDDLLTDVKSAFEGCMEGVDRSTTLVRDLRTFSRLDELERMPADLHTGIDSTLNLLRSQLKGINVVKNYGKIPPVECFSTQLNQVFMNLIANAADATCHGGTVEIRTSLVGSGAVAVEVIDDGAGIAPEHLDRIFDPFFTTKEVGKGTGLGLSISYGIVERHGGRISVQSRPGGGTCFRVELPVEAPDD